MLMKAGLSVPANGVVTWDEVSNILVFGAMFVRSLMVYRVRKGTLDEYFFLEHGAHNAIGVLAGIMLISITHHISETITGLSGAVLIGLSVISSGRYKKRMV